jgi:hypothetical protein
MLRRDSQDSAQRMDGKAAVTESQAARPIRLTCGLHLPKPLRGNSIVTPKWWVPFSTDAPM